MMKAPRPLVSLITPVYNGMPYFKEYLESVISQTWPSLEFICVDDGSEDASAEYFRSRELELKQKGIRLLFIQTEHRGQAQAFNAALPLVTGEFLTWCDADDFLLPENIEKKAEFLLQHPEVGMVRNDGVRIEAGQEELLYSLPLDRRQQNIFDRLFHDKTYCYAGCYMIRTDLFFTCYPDRQIPVSPEGQNLQLLLPPASRTECGFLADKLHIYRIHADSHSTKKRSYTECVQRTKNFSALRQEILTFCECDREYYQQEAIRMEKEYQYQLLRAAAQRAREDRQHESGHFDIS